ncbi:MAG: HisA/HisF-related TIM barrel protein [Methanomicrobiaceae archaeon]|nr:HisA/HisF-related TIM barrel protein [Methanomicrobiaceae archaeon]
MDLILALDLMGGLVVHGSKGLRSTYRPLTWGIASSADPVAYVRELQPRHLYIADLDRIEGVGSHDQAILNCSRMVDRCFVDRGIRSPGDTVGAGSIVPVIGTETAGDDLTAYEGGFLSVDIMDGRAIPRGEDPLQLLAVAEEWYFEGCIILNLGSVGTESGIPSLPLEEMRAVFSRTLLFGGGVASLDDLALLADFGFDGAVVATAVHRGAIPLELIRRGRFC